MTDPVIGLIVELQTIYTTAFVIARDAASVISHGPSHFQDKQSQKRAESFPSFRPTTPPCDAE
jgi:hypothetical protein